MKFAVIEDGVCVNIISSAYRPFGTVILDAGYGIGDRYTEGAWVHFDFEEEKETRINRTKKDLETYLLEHPLLWTDGEYYAITQDKQNQLTSTLVSAQVDGEPPEWNSTGLVCKQWDVAELAALGCAIKNRVKALVKYQQEKELEIQAAETMEELEAITVNYDEVV